MNSRYFKLFILFLILVIGYTFNSLNVNASHSEFSGTTGDGSSYTVEVDGPSSSEVGNSITVTVKLTANSFGSNIRDFHDIVLSAAIGYSQSNLVDNVDISASSISSEGGSTSGQLVLYIPNSYSESSIKLFFGVSFREDKAWATDPTTDTGLHYAYDLSITSTTSSSTTSSSTTSSSTTSSNTGENNQNQFNGVTGDGSSYTVKIDAPSTVILGNSFIVTVTLIANYFGDNIRDFHDVVLKAGIGYSQSNLVDYTSVSASSISSEGGSTSGQLLLYIPADYSDSYVNLFFGVSFREDKSLATDPTTDTGLHYAYKLSTAFGDSTSQSPLTLNSSETNVASILNWTSMIISLMLISTTFIYKRNTNVGT